MMDPQEQRQWRLVTLLAGDRLPQDPEVQTWFADDPSLRDEFEELRRVAGAVEDDAVRERELMAAAARLPGEPAHGSFVAAQLERLAGRPPAPASGPASAVRPSVRVWWGAGLLAAAAVVITGYFVWRGQPQSPRDDQRVLSGAPLVIDEPAAAPDGGLLLSWHVVLPGASFEASIYDPAKGRRAPLLERPDEQGGSTTWTLPKAAVAALPPGSRLFVVARWSGRSVDAERIVR